MGEYRTFFSQKVTNIHDLDDFPKGHTNTTSVCSGNVQHSILSSSPRSLPVRSKNEWQKRKEIWHGRGTCSLRPSPLKFVLLTALLVIQPSASLPTNDIPTSVNSTLSAPQRNDSAKTAKDGYDRFNNPVFPETQLNCTPPSSEEFPADLFSKEQRQHGAIVLHFFVTVYMLYALLLVCDEYFVPSIECICTELRVPHNIAGATFMAISTSAPELFTNVIGTFLTKGDLGVGTIVGSAVFNVLVVGSCVGIGTLWAVQSLPVGVNKRTKRQGVPLDWWSLTRDSTYYMLAVATLIVILRDGRVYWQEASVMLAMYGVYILGMFYDIQCKEFCENCIVKFKQCSSGGNENSHRRLSMAVQKAAEMENENTPLLRKASIQTKRGSKALELDLEQNYQTGPKTLTLIPGQIKKVSVEIPPAFKESLDSTSVSSTDSSCSEESTASSVGLLGLLKAIVTFPIRLLLTCTIPDCRKDSQRKFYPITLLCCIGWIAGLSYVISWMVCIIGETFYIPDSVSGLTFLAAGTSLPEVLSSVIVARQGMGSMGFSNSIGSNTFDILVCLGLPWLIESSILTATDVDYIEIRSGGLAYSSVLLIASLFLLYLMITLNGYNIDFKIGVGCVVMYLIFVVFACLLEMNIFFPVNLPPCN